MVAGSSPAIDYNAPDESGAFLYTFATSAAFNRRCIVFAYISFATTSGWRFSYAIRAALLASQACWYLLHSFNLFKYLLSSLIVPVYSQSGRSQWKQSGHLQLDNLIPIGSPFDLPAAVHIVVRSALVKAAFLLTATIKFLQSSAPALDWLVAHTVIIDTVHLDFCHRFSPLNKVFRPLAGG